jgi:hypothetical protein
VAVVLWYEKVLGDTASIAASNIVFYVAPNTDPHNFRGLQPRMVVCTTIPDSDPRLRNIARWCGSRKFHPAGFAGRGRIGPSSDSMLAIVHLLGTYLANLFKSQRRLEAENLFLRHQLNIALRRRAPRLWLRAAIARCSCG